jgi:hypothetical protein
MAGFPGSTRSVPATAAASPGRRAAAFQLTGLDAGAPDAAGRQTQHRGQCMPGTSKTASAPPHQRALEPHRVRHRLHQGSTHRSRRPVTHAEIRPAFICTACPRHRVGWSRRRFVTSDATSENSSTYQLCILLVADRRPYRRNRTHALIRKPATVPAKMRSALKPLVDPD